MELEKKDMYPLVIPQGQKHIHQMTYQRKTGNLLYRQAPQGHRKQLQLDRRDNQGKMNYLTKGRGKKGQTPDMTKR